MLRIATAAMLAMHYIALGMTAPPRCNGGDAEWGIENILWG